MKKKRNRTISGWQEKPKKDLIVKRQIKLGIIDF